MVLAWNHGNAGWSWCMANRLFESVFQIEASDLGKERSETLSRQRVSRTGREQCLMNIWCRQSNSERRSIKGSHSIVLEPVSLFRSRTRTHSRKTSILPHIDLIPDHKLVQNILPHGHASLVSFSATDHV